MATFKPKPLHCYPYVSPPLHHYGALPFRSRDADTLATTHRVDRNSSRIHNSNICTADFPSAGRESVKGHIKSWLDSSPTSVIEQARGETHPPTPSPICSPSPSSPISSPCTSIRTRRAPSSELLAPGSVRNAADGASNSKRHGKEVSFEAPPESPTGSSLSSGSDGGLLALLASKLLSYRETHRSSSRYAREKSDTIDDKHVMEDDRGSKPPVEEIFVEAHPQSQGTISDYTLYRTPSETLSEISLGSANGRSLSMEFDAMLAAAVATGVAHNTSLNTQGRGVVVEEAAETMQLPGIEEDHSFSSSFAEDRPGTSYREEQGQSMVRIADRAAIEVRMPEAEHFSIAAAAATAAPGATNALALTRQGESVQDSNLRRRRRTEADNEIISESSPSYHGSSSSSGRRTEPETEIVASLPQSSRSSSRGSVRAEPESGNGTMVPYASPSSGRGNGDSLAIVLVSDSSSEASSSSGPSLSVAPDPRRMALEKVRRDKIFAKAIAYQDAKNSKFNNRYKREEAKIIAWENQKRIDASVNMKKVEMKLEEKRARAFEKMQNEIALAHKKAQDKKAIAEAIRGAKTAKVAEVAENIKRTGKVSSRCLPF